MKYIDGCEIEISRKELKMRLSGADPALAEEASLEILKVLRPKYCIRKTDVIHTEKGVDLGFGELVSSNLKRNLRDCKSAYVVCVTIGFDVDALLRKSAVVSSSRQFLLDAAASAAVESVLDKIEEIEITEKTMARFAPGYGDFSIGYQKELLDFTGAEKMGVTLTDSNLMIPTKTITCIIGVLHESF